MAPRNDQNKLIQSMDVGQPPMMALGKLDSGRGSELRTKSLRNEIVELRGPNQEAVKSQRVGSVDQTIQMASTARETFQRHPFGLTNEFGSKPGQKTLREEVTTETGSILNEEFLERTAINWSKINAQALKAGYFTQHISPRVDDRESETATPHRESFDGAASASKRPSVMSDSLAPSTLVATRIPFRNTAINFGSHRLAAVVIREDQ